jgi:hypothetical protein
MLNLNAINLSNYGVKMIAEGISEGSPLISLDLSYNDLSFGMLEDLELIFKKTNL